MSVIKKKAKGGYYRQCPFLSISIDNVSKKSTIDSCRLMLFMVRSLPPFGSDSAGNTVEASWSYSLTYQINVFWVIRNFKKRQIK